MFIFLKAKHQLGFLLALFCYKLNVPIIHRNLLPFLLKVLDLSGEGAEIGVAWGNFSEKILNGSNLNKLYSIDPWVGNCYKRYFKAANKLSIFKERSEIIREASVQAATKIQNESLDFVYIDANHSYESVKQDLELWWPKLKKGGVFSGHDYINGQFPEGLFGVKKAVDEFLEDKNKTKPFITPGFWPTWYFIKKF